MAFARQAPLGSLACLCLRAVSRVGQGWEGPEKLVWECPHFISVLLPTPYYPQSCPSHPGGRCPQPVGGVAGQGSPKCQPQPLMPRENWGLGRMEKLARPSYTPALPPELRFNPPQQLSLSLPPHTCHSWHPHRLFGFVARKQGSSTDNACHLFAELDPNQPASAIVNFVSKVMLNAGQKR